MGKISSGYCDSDAWHGLCSSSSSYLCICSDPPDENIWMDIQQGLIIHDSYSFRS
ncbi:uncharacterized protein M6B38_355360 [Iris pallida]|uniref:Uncharacterized protein n=1 Tax=Iris pallida TaxID=29817 RepID=A0AAX6GNF7_IRIPA|nr:uncharacterized protein M6B38_355360 [Iris pallida]